MTLAARRYAPIPSLFLVVAALFVALPLLAMGNSFLGALVAIRLNLSGEQALTIGLVMSMHSFGFVLGSLYAARIIQTVGHIRAFAGMAGVSCSIALAFPMLEFPLAWALLRLGLGFTAAAMLSVIESWIAARANRHNRGRLLAEYNLVFYLASAGGQYLIGEVELAGFFPFSVAAMLVVLSLVPLALGRSEAPAPSRSQALELGTLYRIAPLAAAGVILAGVCSGAFLMIGPVYALRIGLDTGGVASFMSWAVLAAMVTQAPAGWCSDRLGRLPTFIAICALTVLMSGALLLPLDWSINWRIFLGAAVFGGIATIYPLSAAIANDQLQTEQILPAATTLLLGFGIGNCFGPILTSALIGKFGPIAFSGFFTAVLGLLTLMATHRWLKTRDDLPEQVQFVAAPAMATVVMAEQAPMLAEAHAAEASPAPPPEASTPPDQPIPPSPDKP